MTSWEFDAVLTPAVLRLGPARLRALADRIERDAPRDVVLEAAPGFADEATVIYDAAAGVGAFGARASAGHPAAAPAVAGYLRGAAAALAHRANAVQVEAVWSGPGSHAVPVRATARVLIELIEQATHEVLLMTYSARPYEPVRAALAAALGRGVGVMAVVETLQGAGGALQGQEPATAFTGLPGLRLWQWPVSERRAPSAKMHAKLAVADRRVLLVSSANLTHSGAEQNVEAGVLVRGGSAPRRAAEHIAALRARGVLTRLDDG